MIAAAAAKKKKAHPKQTDAAVPTRPNKRSRLEAEPVIEAPGSLKRTKKLAQKGRREVHLIDSQTTDTASLETSPPAPSAQELPEQRPRPTVPASQVVDLPAASTAGGTETLVQSTAPVLEMMLEERPLRSPQRTATVLVEV